MPIRNYGVWVGIPTSFTVERADVDPIDPHIYLKFKDDTQSPIEYTAAINVKSRSADSRLVYWLVTDLDNGFTNKLTTLGRGFNPRVPGPRLDYLCSNPHLIDIDKGKLLAHDLPGPNNDIIDKVAPILWRAIMSEDAVVYIFGSRFPGGIHNIHMNQGSLPGFDNGIGQDGGIFFYFPDEDRWEAIFLAFASQSIPREGGGLITLGERLGHQAA